MQKNKLIEIYLSTRARDLIDNEVISSEFGGYFSKCRTISGNDAHSVVFEKEY